MTDFTVLINNHNTALYTWNEFMQLSLQKQVHTTEITRVIFRTKFMPRIECSIVIFLIMMMGHVNLTWLI